MDAVCSGTVSWEVNVLFWGCHKPRNHPLGVVSRLCLFWFSFILSLTPQIRWNYQIIFHVSWCTAGFLCKNTWGILCLRQWNPLSSTELLHYCRIHSFSSTNILQRQLQGLHWIFAIIWKKKKSGSLGVILMMVIFMYHLIISITSHAFLLDPYF